MNWEKWHVMILAISSAMSVFLAAVGIWIGLSALNLTKEIEYAKITPYVDFEIELEEGRRAVYLVNAGSGVGIIREFDFRKRDGTYVSAFDIPYHQIYSALDFPDILGDPENEADPKNYRVDISIFGRETFLGPGEEFEVLREYGSSDGIPGMQASFAEFFRNLWQEDRMRVTVCDVLSMECATKYL